MPKGQTKVKVGDILVLSGNDLSEVDDMMKPAEIGKPPQNSKIKTMA